MERCAFLASGMTSYADREEPEMTTHRRLRRIVAIACTSLFPLWIVVGCGGDDSTPDADPAGIDAPPESSESAGESGGDEVVELVETFEDDANGWALPPSSVGTMEVTGGDFVWEVSQAGLRPHVIATTLGMAYDEGRLEMTDVRVTTTVTPQRGAAAFGLFCREVPDTDADFQWYEFVVRDGYSAIRLADTAGNLEPVAEGDASVPLGEEAALEIGCVGDRLSLSLNGEELLTATAPQALGNGVPGLQAYDSPEGSEERLVLAWHDFAIEPA
jgi:hypothetical protein